MPLWIAYNSLKSLMHGESDGVSGAQKLASSPAKNWWWWVAKQCYS